ncbi:MAG TPA: hypothetical protein VF538_03895 [Pyrinomonadaceae bacterium]|jgi:hypothetical protein
MRKRKRLERRNPTIVILNKSRGLIEDAEIERIIKALQRQVNEHFQPVWGIGAELKFRKANAVVPKNCYRIVIYDKARAGDAGFLGYHFQRNGNPVASIFAKEDLVDDKTISDTLSHEVLEMLVDPALNLYAYRPGDGTKRRDRGYFYEVCDAVQCMHYRIDGVRVCNFVYPEWFEYAWPRDSRKFDHRGALREPFEILEGCYADIREAGTGWRTIYGDHTPAKKKKARRRRRDARLLQQKF